MTRLSAFALAAALAVLVHEPAAAQRQAPQSRAEVQLSFAPVVKRAAPAVVNVYGARVEQVQNHPFFDDPIFRRFFGDRSGQGGPQGPGRAEVARSLGSGVIVDRAGLVITNNHVIQNMTEVKIAFADRREFEVDIVLRDPRTDLAVLKLKNPPADLAVLDIGDSDGLEVGDIVLAIGNPFGVGQTVTQGIISALARTQVGVADYQSFVQTDAAINPGNSGGALVDMSGRLVGVNTAIFSRSGGSHGIGFAIPANMVRSVMESARNGGGVVRRPWFGASLQPVTSELAETLSMTRPVGALVAGVVAGGPAEQAGIKRLDVITAVDGVEIEDPDGFGYRFATKQLGGTVKLTLQRAGRKQDVSLRLIAAPEVPARNPVKVGANSPFQGITAINISPAVKEELSLSGIDSGVVVGEIEPGSAAEQVGFQKSDVIIAINGQRIEETGALDRVAKTRNYLWRVTFNRGGQTFTTALGG